MHCTNVCTSVLDFTLCQIYLAIHFDCGWAPKIVPISPPTFVNPALIPVRFLRHGVLVLRVCVCVLQAEWVWCLNQTIARALLSEKAAAAGSDATAAAAASVGGGVGGSALVLLPPPRDRHASYKFRKVGTLKDAQYKGLWRAGKIHGQSVYDIRVFAWITGMATIKTTNSMSAGLGCDLD